MLLRLVSPVRRKSSSNAYFNQRIPADVKPKTAGLRLDIPVGTDRVAVTLTKKADFVRLSLRTSDAGVAKIRNAEIGVYLEMVFRALRQDQPVALTHKQATALAGELYRAWEREEDDRTIAMIHDPHTGLWQRSDDPADSSAEWQAVNERWAGLEDTDLEPHLGPLVDRLLLKKGIRAVDARSRNDLLQAFWMALRDAFAQRQRHAEGDYRIGHNSERFPNGSRQPTRKQNLPRCLPTAR